MIRGQRHYERARYRAYHNEPNRGEFKPEDCGSDLADQLYRPYYASASALLRSWLSKVRGIPPECFELGYVFREDWGAQARLDFPWRYVLMSHKLPLTCERLARVLLKQRDTFVSIGQAQAEGSSTSERSESFGCSGHVKSLPAWIRGQLVDEPRCTLRASVASCVGRVVFHTLLLHELAHHLYGHLDLTAPDNSRLAWDGKPHARDRHALELDADAFAANQVIRILLLPAREQHWRSEPWRALAPNLEEASKSIGMILGCAYWMLDPIARGFTEYTGEHPHPFARICVVSHTCEMWASRHCGDQAGIVQRAIFDGFLEASRVFCGSTDEIDSILSSFDREEYFADIESRQVRLRRILVPFTRVPLPILDE